MSAPQAPATQPVAARLATFPRSMGWAQFTALVLSVLGLVDSGYQTFTKLSGTGLAGCSASGDPCVLDQNSPQAYIFGIPFAVFGLVFYVFMVAICLPLAWRSARPLVRRVRLAAVVVGMVFVLYLIYVELVELGHLCPYCTSVHIITFLLFSVIVYQATASGPQRQAVRSRGEPGSARRR